MRTSARRFSRPIPSFTGASRCFINLPFDTLSKLALSRRNSTRSGAVAMTLLGHGDEPNFGLKEAMEAGMSCANIS